MKNLIPHELEQVHGGAAVTDPKILAALKEMQTSMSALQPPPTPRSQIDSFGGFYQPGVIK